MDAYSNSLWLTLLQEIEGFEEEVQAVARPIELTRDYANCTKITKHHCTHAC